MRIPCETLVCNWEWWLSIQDQTSFDSYTDYWKVHRIWLFYGSNISKFYQKTFDLGNVLGQHCPTRRVVFGSEISGLATCMVYECVGLWHATGLYWGKGLTCESRIRRWCAVPWRWRVAVLVDVYSCCRVAILCCSRRRELVVHVMHIRMMLGRAGDGARTTPGAPRTIRWQLQFSVSLLDGAQNVRDGKRRRVLVFGA